MLGRRVIVALFVFAWRAGVLLPPYWRRSTLRSTARALPGRKAAASLRTPKLATSLLGLVWARMACGAGAVPAGRGRTARLFRGRGWRGRICRRRRRALGIRRRPGTRSWAWDRRARAFRGRAYARRGVRDR